MSWGKVGQGTVQTASTPNRRTAKPTAQKPAAPQGNSRLWGGTGRAYIVELPDFVLLLSLRLAPLFMPDDLWPEPLPMLPPEPPDDWAKEVLLKPRTHTAARKI